MVYGSGDFTHCLPFTTHTPYSYGDSAGLTPASLFILRLERRNQLRAANVGKKWFGVWSLLFVVYYMLLVASSYYQCSGLEQMFLYLAEYYYQLPLRRTLDRSELY